MVCIYFPSISDGSSSDSSQGSLTETASEGTFSGDQTSMTTTPEKPSESSGVSADQRRTSPPDLQYKDEVYKTLS